MGKTVFEKNGQKIIFGEALAGLAQIADQSVDLIFADPPYNIGKKFGDFVDRWASDEEYLEWSKKWLSLAITKLKPTGSMYVMCSTQCMPLLDIYLRHEIHVLGRIIWSYDSSGVQAKSYYGSMYEPILYCVKDLKAYTFNGEDIKVEAKTGAKRKLIDYRKAIPTPYNNEKIPGNVWEFARVRYRMPEYEEHPTQKPEALLERVIKASSNKGDIVLDPFAGSFSTGAVAKRLGRKSISIEINEDYLKIGLRRLGIATNYKGQPLLPPAKNFELKNSAGKKGGSQENPLESP